MDTSKITGYAMVNISHATCYIPEIWKNILGSMILNKRGIYIIGKTEENTFYGIII